MNVNEHFTGGSAVLCGRPLILSISLRQSGSDVVTKSVHQGPASAKFCQGIKMAANLSIIISQLVIDANKTG